MAACAVEGDFGRIRPTPLTTTTDDILLNANIITRGLQRNELTRDETILREIGDAMRRPMEFQPALTDIPLRTPQHPAGSRFDRDPVALAPEVIARELDRDHQLLTRFGEAARRVIRSYAQQMEKILRYDPALMAKRREEARIRMQENTAYIDTVFLDFGRRLQSYHYAIGEQRTDPYNPFSGELEASLAHLRDRTASLEYELKHYFGAVMARTQYHPPAREAHYRPRLGLREFLSDRLGLGHESAEPQYDDLKSFK